MTASRQWGGLAIVGVALLAFGLLVRSPFVLDLAISALFYATLGQAWNWVAGFAGQVSFGHALFFGSGAYAAAMCATAWHLSPWLSFPIGIGLAVAVALVVGYPCFALRGHYFSIATIAVAAIADAVARASNAIGGAAGIEMPIAHPGGLAQLQFSGKLPYFALALALFAAAQAATILLARSRAGYYLRAIRANQEAAMSIGVDVRAWKLAALAASAAMCATVGGLYAQYVLFVDPESTLALPISIAIALVGVVGGLGTLWGPAVGATVYIVLARFVAAKLGGSGLGIDLVVYGGLIVVVACLQPGGIVGAVRALVGSRALPAATQKAAS